ncbi:MAG TPA: hypothetical protein PKE06_24025 [Flavilitoribacter sp.]|nr:hypothetical protein [Flavilitoribacter sp.]HMQ88473.1 hypothetical protein [Flavilitoribacter sp.]
MRIRPAGSLHLLVGAGAYALGFPDLMVGLDPKNKDKGWDVRIADAWSLFGEYYFDEAGRKWFAGLQAGIQNFRIRNEGLPGAESRYRNLILMPSVGYSWSPFRIPVYIKPWVGIGYTAKVSGNNRIEGAEYNISPILPFATLHMGYVF